MTQGLPIGRKEVVSRVVSGLAGGGGSPFSRLVVRVNDANFNIAAVPNQDVDVWMRGLSADRTVQLPAAPLTVGQRVIVKDEDGTLAAHNIVVDGNGHTIDGFPAYAITAAVEGPLGSIMIEWNGVGWGFV